ncbi:MAG TPA: acyl-CoA thioesterase [Terricaulis sp.]|nr:acyl-CoA thioesterase [Terricaulis sp.]HRP09495.1 acyl-CoA thioesterase [Terricaulis sp.]
MKAIVSASAEAVPQFYDLDPLNIVWHGNYPKYLELGRCALMDKIGYGYSEMATSGFVWPFIDYRMRYARPMRLNTPVRITAGIVEWESMMRIVYTIAEVESGERVMRASSSQVAVSIESNEMQWQSPAAFLDKLTPFLPPSS